MISVVVNSLNCWLLNHEPNTEEDSRLGVSIEVDAQRSKTGNSSRRPKAITPIYNFEWSSAMQAGDYYALLNATRVAQDEPFLAPLWPHAIRVGIDTATITAGLVVAWTGDWATYAINPGSLAGYTYAAPLIYGRLAQQPRLAAQSDDLVTVAFSIDEDAPVSFTLSAAAGLLPADTTFNTAGGFAAPVFPFVPERARPGLAVTEVERTSNSSGRIKSSTYYPQIPEQLHEATFSLRTTADAARMIAWWTRRSGITDPHWVALSQKLGKLSVSPEIGNTALVFESAIAPLGTAGYIALFDANERVAIGRVSSATSTQINLAAGVAQAWDKMWTTVSTAMLARHTSKELVLEYNKSGESWFAVCKLAWREVAPEYAPPAGETRGTTLGRLPAFAWFFKIELDYNGVVQNTYLTSWESGANISGHDWTYNDCSFDKLIQDVDLEDDSGMFYMRWYDGCPFENWQPGQLAARGYITIYRADATPAGVLSNFAQLMKGELGRPTLTGPNVQSRISGANAEFARMVPRQMMTTLCGTNLFKARCGLALGDWTFNASVVSVVGNVIVIGSITRANGGGLPGGFAAQNWFALGWLGWTQGGAPMRDGVLANAAIGGGQVSLTVSRTVVLAVGTNVTVVPGCNRMGDTCETKFNNYPNFRGYPFIPSVSPSLVVPTSKTTSAKK